MTEGAASRREFLSAASAAAMAGGAAITTLPGSRAMANDPPVGEKGASQLPSELRAGTDATKESVPAAGASRLPSEEIWDLHCHFAGMPGRTPEERIERLLQFADRMKIRKLCVYMGTSFSHDPTPDELRKQNDEVLQALKAGKERTLGFVYLNPKFPRESLDELNRCVADGPMVGVKLWVAMHASDPALDNLLRRAAELQAVVFQHTWIKAGGNLPGESTPMDVAILAARHPEARIICGHTGGDWERGIRAIRSLPNVSADLAGGDPVSGITEMAVRELGAERVIYGSDVPGRSFATQLAKVTGAALSEDARQKILAENLKRMLTPILTWKGIPL